MTIQLAYSNLACPDWQFERTVEAVANYGFDGIEIRLFDGEVVTPGLSSQSRRRAETALRHTGVPVAALCSSLQVTTAEPKPFAVDLKIMVEMAQQWGAPVLRLFGGPLPAEPAERVEALKRAGDVLAEAAPPVARDQVRLAVETHDDFSSARTLSELLLWAGNTAGAVYDVFHPHRLGQRPPQVLQMLGHYLCHVQVKDAVRLPGDDNWQLVLLGEGEVPVPELLELLVEGGYDRWVSLEFEKKWHPELPGPDQALRPQAQFLRRWLTQLQ